MEKDPLNPSHTQELYKDYILTTYAQAPLSLAKGRGVRVWDEEGRAYLDFATGVAVNGLGHCHPHWVQAMQEQINTLVHTSNLYSHRPQGELAAKLVQYAGPGKVFFCNSGTEANEAAIKLARLHGKAVAGSEGQKYRVLTALGSFHGRTLGSMAATGQDKIKTGFAPMLEGFDHAPLNDLKAFADKVDPNTTAAIMIETLQGEGGVHPCTTEFLQGLRDLCDQHELLMIIDEVQCGAGRSGDYFAFKHSGVKPDVIVMAKGLAAGFPIGAIWVTQKYADLFQPGSHGSTFGGNPLACTAALAALEVIEQEQLLASVQQNSIQWLKQLNALRQKYADRIKEVRGLGYLIGLCLNEDPIPLVSQLRQNGLLTVPAAANTIRLLPPLIATLEDLSEATAIIDKVFSQG